MLKNFSDLNIIEEDDEASFLIECLLQAADEGNLEEVRNLLQDHHHSIQATSTNKHLETALHFSSSSGHLEVCKYLVERGADVNCKDKHGETPLYWAARQGNVEIVEWLVTQGTFVDAANQLGQTAMIAAVKYARIEMVQLLCRLHANVNHADEQGETVAHCISWMDLQPEVCDVIFSLPLIYLDAKNNNSETSMHIAAGRGNMYCLDSLMRHGADVNCADKRGSTPLHLACHCQHIPVIKQLLMSNKINLSTADQNGDTPLHVVSQSGLLKGVQLLCWHGCFVDSLNKLGKTPLHIASKLGHTEIVRCLLRHGASVNYPYKDNVTAHMMAAAKGKNDTADLLSKLTPDKQHASIRQLVVDGGRLETVKMKVFGSSGVGKSSLVQALNTGFFGKYFGKRQSHAPAKLLPPSQPFQTPPSSSSSSFSSIPSIVNQEQNKSDIRYNDQGRSGVNPSPIHAAYTRGIHVTKCKISGGVGQLSVWEFSGFEGYFPLYDKFIGDVNCIHVVSFDVLRSNQNISLAPPNSNFSSPQSDPSNPFSTLSPVHHFKNINYWLNFLKSRIPASEPIGKEGQLHGKAKVVLVGIVHGLSKAQLTSLEDSETYKQLQELCLCMKNVYKMDLELHPEVFIVDPSQPSSLKTFKSCLSQLKQLVCQFLPPSSTFLDATVAVLPAWRRVLSGYPVVTWSNFVKYIRTSVNLLCGQEHLKELIYKLQIMGEVIFIETKENEDDLVVLDVNWLCSGVLGSLFSHELSMGCRKSGCYGIDDFQFIFPDYEAGEVLHLLEALSLSNRCNVSEKDDGNTYEDGRTILKKKSLSVLELNSLPSGDHKDFGCEFEIPCLNFITADRSLWEKKSPQSSVNTVYAGSRYSLSCQYCHTNVSTSLHIKQKSFQTNDLTSFSASSLKRVNGMVRNGSLSGTSSLERTSDSSSNDKQTPKPKLTGISHPFLPSYLFSHLSLPPKAADEFSLECKHAFNQLSHVFTRIQFEMRKQQTEGALKSELKQCYHACKYSRDEMEVLVTFEKDRCESCAGKTADSSLDEFSSGESVNESSSSSNLCYCCHGFIEVKCRGPSEMAGELFDLLKSTRHLVETTISMCCPSLEFYHHLLSSTQLSEHKNNVQTFSQREVLEAYQHSGVDAIVCYEEDNNDDEECVESLIDLLAFGSSEVFDSISLATDLSVSCLGLKARRQLASLLDPSDQTGCDWCMLAIKLGLSQHIPQFDCVQPDELPVSKTNRILQLLTEAYNAPNNENDHNNNSYNDYNNNQNDQKNHNNDSSNKNEQKETQESLPKVTLGQLISKLQDLGRNDAVDVVYNLCPLMFRPEIDNCDAVDDQNNNDLDDEYAHDYNTTYDRRLASNNTANFNGSEFMKRSNNNSNTYGLNYGVGEENTSRDDEGATSDEGNLDEDMYIDDNYDAFDPQ